MSFCFEKRANFLGRKLFCDINPTCYKISVKKETFLRNVKDFLSREKIAKEKSEELLPNVVKSHSSILVRKLEGVDIRLQEYGRAVYCHPAYLTDVKSTSRCQEKYQKLQICK